jgi:hypothetical protein
MVERRSWLPDLAFTRVKSRRVKPAASVTELKAFLTAGIGMQAP